MINIKEGRSMYIIDDRRLVFKPHKKKKFYPQKHIDVLNTKRNVYMEIKLHGYCQVRVVESQAACD